MQEAVKSINHLYACHPAHPTMHIVYLTHQFLPESVGGVEVYTLALARHARAAGHTVTVITYRETASINSADFGAQFTSYDSIPLVEIYDNLSMSPLPARYEYDNPFIANILRHVLLKLKPDIVHVMHAMKLSVSALDVCDALRIPFILTLCDFWFICPRHTLLKWDRTLCEGPAHPLYCLRCVQELHGFAKRPNFLRDLPFLAKRNKFIRQRVLKARRIIALSEFQKEMYSRNGVPAHRIEVIQHGLEGLTLDAPQHVPAKPYCIGYIGSLVEHKGVHILLEALARIPGEDLQCKIYGALGSSAYVARLRELAARDQRVRLMQTFEPSQLTDVIDKIDILALPSLWYENEPLVIKAALRAGVPTLCSDIGSLSGMIAHNETGWLVPPGDVPAWAEAIRQALAALPGFHMEPVRIKTMDENAAEILSIYAQVTG
jgi:glycosyltransferase involved in cell wall biosynthesis